jgi:hypothetical protein
MKLFGRSSGYYLFWTGFVYFWAGMYLAFTHAARPEIATLGFVLALSVPLWCPPVARYFNMEPLMFDWFKKDKTPSNVVPFPEQPKLVPYVEPPKEPEKPAHTYYRLGLTDNNRVSFTMGYSEITMNAAGIDSMIKLLETYRDLIQVEKEDEEC